MSDLIKKVREKLEFDDRAKSLESEFRYACYPDADKDELQTLLADYACHGFAAGVGVRFDRVKPIIEALIAVAKVASQGVDGKTRLVVPGDTWHERMNKALAELEKAVDDDQL